MAEQLFNIESLRRFKNVNGIYQGVVLDNSGAKGRCKIFIPQVFADEFSSNPEGLPWAIPAMPVLGGAALVETPEALNTSTGTCTVPRIGAHLWVFFADNDHTRPVYFASVQSDSNWFSENRYQSVYQTENVSITIDESPAVSAGVDLKTETAVVYEDEETGVGGDPATISKPLEKSSKFGSTFNSDALLHADKIQGKGTQRFAVPIRLEVRTKGTVQIIVKEGHANIRVEGDTCFETMGNMYTTVGGDRYTRVKGNSYESIDGFRRVHVAGDSTDIVDGNSLRNILGSSGEFVTIRGGNQISIGRAQQMQIGAGAIIIVNGAYAVSSSGSTNISSSGDISMNYGGNYTLNVAGDLYLSANGKTTVNSESTTSIVGTDGVSLKIFDGTSSLNIDPVGVRAEPLFSCPDSFNFA